MQTRREFLKTSLLGTGGLVLGGLSLDSALYAKSKKLYIWHLFQKI